MPRRRPKPLRLPSEIHDPVEMGQWVHRIDESFPSRSRHNILLLRLSKAAQTKQAKDVANHAIERLIKSDVARPTTNALGKTRMEIQQKRFYQQFEGLREFLERDFANGSVLNAKHLLTSLSRAAKSTHNNHMLTEYWRRLFNMTDDVPIAGRNKTELLSEIGTQMVISAEKGKDFAHSDKLYDYLRQRKIPIKTPFGDWCFHREPIARVINTPVETADELRLSMLTAVTRKDFFEASKLWEGLAQRFHELSQNVPIAKNKNYLRLSWRKALFCAKRSYDPRRALGLVIAAKKQGIELTPGR
ncbi:MAG: hypothetical protein Q7R47_01375 [Candidatus Diapherotrites archaeon]|nr:hypothetical protein [Candidatus Diapherotrites archaeon]